MRVVRYSPPLLPHYQFLSSFYFSSRYASSSSSSPSPPPPPSPPGASLGSRRASGVGRKKASTGVPGAGSGFGGGGRESVFSLGFTSF